MKEADRQKESEVRCRTISSASLSHISIDCASASDSVWYARSQQSAISSRLRS